MKASHTITISFTIPTAKILGFLAGVAAGLALVWSVSAGVDLWAPVLGLPLLARRRPAEAVQDVQEAPEDHPAIEAFKSVPFPVRVALNDLVDRVIAEKHSRPAIAAFETVPTPVRVALNDLVDRVIAEKRKRAA